MILVLLILSVPSEALLCRQQAKNTTRVFLTPNSHIDLECVGDSNISVSTPAGKIEIKNSEQNSTRFKYLSPK